MLEEQLKKAKRADSQRRASASLKLVAAGVGALLVLTVVTMLWDTSPNGAQKNASGQAVTDQNSSGQNMALRGAFKDALKDFETTFDLRVSSEPFGLWNGDAKHQILSFKANAISLFSTSDYAEALATLQLAVNLSASELEAMDRAFDAALASAGDRYSKDAYDLAKVDITRALGLHPEDQGTLALAALIDALPRVLELLNVAQVAHAENDLKKEVKNLRIVLALTPERNGLKDRLDTLEGQLRERAFAVHIQNGMKRVTNRDIKSARSSLSAAQKLLPERAELSVLRAQVQNLSQTLKVEALLENARQAANQEDWNSALTLYTQVAKIEPNNKKVVEEIVTAQTILSLSAKINGHLKSASRLASPNVMAGARVLVDESAPYFKRSPVLKTKVQKLRAVLEGYSKKVALLIRSDNQTEISVRGVGRVGQIKQKYIELTPGTYTFEGSCPGYKSRLIRVAVLPNATDMVLEVICNERL